MAVCRVSFGVLVAIVALFAVVLPLAHAQSPVSAPSPSPTSDGNSFSFFFYYITKICLLRVSFYLRLKNYRIIGLIYLSSY